MLLPTMKRQFAVLLMLISSLASHALAEEEGSTNAVKIVIKVAHMGKAVSNELVRVSQDESITQDLRTLAQDVLASHNTAGTNTYAQIEQFITTFSITNQPTITSNVIMIMKETLETGISAKKKLETYIADTNFPAEFRGITQAMLDFLNRPEQ